MKNMLLVAAAALLIPATLPAQDQPQTQPRPRMLGQNTIEWILTQKQEFRPSAEQVASLEQAAKKLNEQTAELREEIRKSREEGMAGDREAFREKMRPLMQKMRKLDEDATNDALKILNDEQRKVVEELLAARRKQMEERGPRFRS